MPSISRGDMMSDHRLNKNNNNTSEVEHQLSINEPIKTAFTDPDELTFADFARFLYGIGETTNVLFTEDIRKLSDVTTIMSDWQRMSQLTSPTQRMLSATTFLSVTQTLPIRISKVHDTEEQHHSKQTKRLSMDHKSQHEKQNALRLLWCCSDPPQQLETTQKSLELRCQSKREQFARSYDQDWKTELMVYSQLGHWAPEMVPINSIFIPFMPHGNQRSPSLTRGHSATLVSYGSTGRRQLHRFTNMSDIYNFIQEGRATVPELNMLINTCNFGSSVGIKRSTVFREENKQATKKRNQQATIRTSDILSLSERWPLPAMPAGQKSAVFSVKSIINTAVLGKLNAINSINSYQNLGDGENKFDLKISSSSTAQTVPTTSYVAKKPDAPDQSLVDTLYLQDKHSIGRLWHVDRAPLSSMSDSSSGKEDPHIQQKFIIVDKKISHAGDIQSRYITNRSTSSELPELDVTDSTTTTTTADEEGIKGITDSQPKLKTVPSGISGFTWSMEFSHIDARPSDRRRLTRLSQVRTKLPFIAEKSAIPDLQTRLSLPDLIKNVFNKIRDDTMAKKQVNRLPSYDKETKSETEETILTSRIVENLLKKQPAVARILRTQCETITAGLRKALHHSAGVNIPDLISQKLDEHDSKRFFLPTVVPIQVPNMKRLKRRETETRMAYPALSFASSVSASDSIVELPALASRSFSRYSRRDTIQFPYRRTISMVDKKDKNASNQSNASKKMKSFNPVELFDFDTHVFMLPRLPPKPGSLLDAIACELHSGKPFVLDHFRQTCSQVIPDETWAVETDGDKILIALERLAADLLLYRNSSGHSIRYKLISVLAAGELNYVLRRQLRSTASQPGHWLDQMLRSLISVHVSCRAEAAVCVAYFVTQRRLMSYFTNAKQAITISGIIHSLFVAGDHYPDSWPEFYIALGYLLEFNQHAVFCETLIDRGQLAGFGGSTACWPRLLAYVYTYWKPSVLRRIDMSEKRLSLLLDAALLSPISRKAARECLAALSEYYSLRTHLFSYWTWKDQQLEPDESLFS